MGRFTAEGTYIASICPIPLEPIVKAHGPSPEMKSPKRTTYRLLPVERPGKPCVIEVNDGWELVPDLMQSQGKLEMTPKPVPYQNIVNSLLNEWQGGIFGAPQGANLGIKQIANTTPTQADLKQMTASFTLYAEYQFQRGERASLEKKFTEITEWMKICALWLGKHAGWADPGYGASLVNCPVCRELIDPESIVCIKCHTRLKALPEHLARLNQPTTGASL